MLSKVSVDRVVHEYMLYINNHGNFFFFPVCLVEKSETPLGVSLVNAKSTHKSSPSDLVDLARQIEKVWEKKIQHNILFHAFCNVILQFGL